MISKSKKKIIVKFLNNQATSEELDALELWLKAPEHKKAFNHYVKINYLIDYNLKTFNADKTKSELQHLIKKDHKIIRFNAIKSYTKYAALVTGIMLSIYVVKHEFFNEAAVNNTIIVNTPIEPGTGKAILTLEDGSQIALEKGASIQTQDANSNGEEIIYEAKANSTTEVVYNYLSIPRGGQFFIKLSDGTQVWLNSESHLKYPVHFMEGETRAVELVYGEAYFDVSPSTEHKGAKFKVINQSQEVEVLGTEFNIKAYKDENTVYTTLVEGKVALNSVISNQILKPRQQTKLNVKEHSISIYDVDVYNEISWKDGVFSFRKKPLEEIMTVLSRWYDVNVEFENENLKKVGFNGVLGKDQNIEDILNIIKNFGIIEDYSIKNKQIILK